MAYDKVVDSASLDSKLTQVADAIRTKGNTSADLQFPSGFISAIPNIVIISRVIQISNNFSTTNVQNTFTTTVLINTL